MYYIFYKSQGRSYTSMHEEAVDSSFLWMFPFDKCHPGAIASFEWEEKARKGNQTDRKMDDGNSETGGKIWR